MKLNTGQTNLMACAVLHAHIHVCICTCACGANLNIYTMHGWFIFYGCSHISCYPLCAGSEYIQMCSSCVIDKILDIIHVLVIHMGHHALFCPLRSLPAPAHDVHT